MIKHTLLSSTLASILVLSTGVTFAADQKQVYGSQLMTQQERVEIRTRLREAKTIEERERIRNEHHKKMKERAKKQGVTLPDKPSMKRKGMGPGDGRGPGAGMGR